MLATQEGRTLPPAVTSLIATDTSYGRNGQIDLAWDPTDVEDFAYYSVYASATEITDVSGLSPIDRINNNTDVTYQVTKYWANGLSLDLSAFMEDTEYWLAVTTVDLDGNESELITTISATIEMMPPAASVFIKVVRWVGIFEMTTENVFQPETVTIPIGTTVLWTNIDEFLTDLTCFLITNPHTVTSDTGLFHGDLTDWDVVFSYTFTEAGVFSYYDERHDWQTGEVLQGWAGKLIVVE